VIQPSSRIPEGRKPAWLKVRAPAAPNYMRLKSRLREWNLHSVCEEAHCPNIGECWEDATATFMILGDICTRNCGYCAIAHGTPVWEDREEPERIGRAVGELGLEYVVITSVNRDDLADGGARTGPRRPRGGPARATLRVEVLIPDFQGAPRRSRRCWTRDRTSSTTTPRRWSSCRARMIPDLVGISGGAARRVRRGARRAQ